MKKAVALIDSDPILKQLDDERRAFNDRMEEMAKKAEEERKSFWSKLEVRLAEMGVLPEGFNDEWQVSTRSGAIVVISPDHKDGKEKEIPKELEHLLKKILR